MKVFFALIVSLLFVTAQAQEHLNLKNGSAAERYDVVAYFNNKALKGEKRYTYKIDGATYMFSSSKNLETFKNNPDLYKPQYGGYCAYAVAIKNEKVSINPKSFQIVDNKLYLFYDSWGIDTRDKWNEEGSKKLQNQADANWKNIVKKKS